MPSSLKLSNNAIGRLAGNIAAAATSIGLTPGDGAKFPALAAGQWFPATLVRSDGVYEVIRVTVRAGDTLTVTRAQESTAAVAFNAGDRIELRLTSGALQGEFDRIEGLANAAQDAADTAQGAADAAQATANAAIPKAGGALSGALNEAKAANVVSAASPNIWSGNGNVLHITGTTAITGFAAAPQAGARRKLIFDGAVTLTHGANLIVEGAANYTTAAGDIVEVVADTTTQFRLQITRANGRPVATDQATETVRGTAEVATQAETDAGTDDARIVTPLKLLANINSKMFGAGQTLTNVTASRAIGTTYTNSTGRPIFVAALITIASGITGLGKVNEATVWHQFAQSAATNATVILIVPNGATYSVTASSGLSSWWELR